MQLSGGELQHPIRGWVCLVGEHNQWIDRLALTYTHVSQFGPQLYQITPNVTTRDFYFIPVEDGVYTFEPTDGAPDFNLDTPGIQYLAVYETAPVESLLDLYYETSTSGLISDLNQAVVNNQDVQGGLDLFPFTSTLKLYSV